MIIDLNIIETELKKKNDVLTRMKIENDTIDKQIGKNTLKINQHLEELKTGQEAIDFVNNISMSRRGVMKSQIENIVTEALQFIYGLDYRIELVYGIKNNRPSMDIELVKKVPEGEVRREIDGYGGGVADTISVPLRLLVLLSSKQTDKVCILDECWKHMNPERVPRVAEFIKEVSNRLGIQIFICSHWEDMKEAADKVYAIEDVNGKAVLHSN